MKKTALLLIVFIFQVSLSFGQFEDPNPPASNGAPSAPSIDPIKERTSIKEKINVGGGLDLRFGNFTVIGLTPLVSYKITDDFMAGGIFTYRYFKDNISKYSTSTYGFAPFLRYNVYNGFFVHAEYEMLKGNWDYYRQPFWINSLFVGGGYAVPMGDRGFAALYALWNLTEDPNYRIYNNPEIRVGFGFGL